ncbi:MFS transporter [Roseobacter sp.]|uniref:MFS transporter n=1 Tax=Roseobacter sp. TaxID=1907202 RepID=UPI0032986455
MSEPSEPAPKRAALWADSEWRAVVAAFALNGLLFGAWAARVPAFKDRFDLAPGPLGLLLLALAGGAIVSFPIAGVLSERLRPHRLTLLCAWAYLPALVVLGVAPTPLALGAALFLFGAAHGAMDVAMNGWGARVETRVGRSTMSIFHAMFSVGAGLGAASGVAAAYIGLDPSAHFAVLAVVGGACGVSPMLAAKPPHFTPTIRGASTPRAALPSGPLFLMGLIAFSVSMGEGAMADWSAVFMQVTTHASQAQSALGYAVFSATMVCVRLSGGVLIERFGPVTTVRASAATAFVGLILAITGQQVAIVLVGFALTGAGYAIVTPLVFARAACDPDIAPGPAIASVATLGYGGMLLGPPVIGFIAHLSNMRLSFLVLAGLAVLAALLATKLKLRAE